MKIYDISIPISEDMIVYKNRTEKKPVFNIVADYDKNSVYETDICLNLHTGTHVDAPLHVFKNGQMVDKYPLEKFCGDAIVIDLSIIEGCIDREHLTDKDIQINDIVILKTKNSEDAIFNFDFTYLSISGARYLSEKKIKTVGIDGLGIERNQADHATHKELLGQNIPIIEGLHLKDVKEGRYQFIGFPISIASVEASLLRAVLIEK
ncbi:MAG: cyclase family protein [Eubacteriales bacterium]|nr:cyclase family protein [Eubacteriales bacterium]